MPPSNCVCGSPWDESVANTMIAGMGSSPRPSVEIVTKDSQHEMDDVHPFHLPHVFNECPADTNAPCTLNTTTVTQSVVKSGDLFPANVTTLSAFELKTKVKSRQAVWQKAGLGSGSDALDKVPNLCKDVNQKAYEWALANADTATVARFLEGGEPLVMVDYIAAPIGITGPTWIKNEMVYNRILLPS